jgi:excisionase family DNA binding protein
MDQLLTSKELANKLNITRRTLYKLINKGLPHIRVNGGYRFDEGEVIQWLRSRSSLENISK